MGDFLTIDVVDRPAEGAVRGLRRLLRAARPAGCRGLVPCATTRFVPYPVGAYTPRRIALLAAWEDEDAADRAGALLAGGREHWHVRGPLAFCAPGADPWRGWVPDAEADRRQDFDGPAVSLISGDLRTSQTVKFLRDNAQVVKQLRRAPGYLGGIGLASGLSDTTSFGHWASTQAMRDFAFAAGAHKTAYTTDMAEQRHSSKRFLRLRPTAARGTLDGRNPLAGLVPEPQRARALA